MGFLLWLLMEKKPSEKKALVAPLVQHI